MGQSAMGHWSQALELDPGSRLPSVGDDCKGVKGAAVGDCALVPVGGLLADLSRSLVRSRLYRRKMDVISSISWETTKRSKQVQTPWDGVKSTLAGDGNPATGQAPPAPPRRGRWFPNGGPSSPDPRWVQAEGVCGLRPPWQLGPEAGTPKGGVAALCQGWPSCFGERPSRLHQAAVPARRLRRRGQKTKTHHSGSYRFRFLTAAWIPVLNGAGS